VPSLEIGEMAAPKAQGGGYWMTFIKKSNSWKFVGENFTKVGWIGTNTGGRGDNQGTGLRVE
jgi:hypothetical protein